MLPNNFPCNRQRLYTTRPDATLWYFQAVREYFNATNDIKLLDELFPVLDAIVDAHVHGTRYNIHVDASDGLLYAGEAGVQLTWMDAKVGDRVITPRIGKTGGDQTRCGSTPDVHGAICTRYRTRPDRYENLGNAHEPASIAFGIQKKKILLRCD